MASAVAHDVAAALKKISESVSSKCAALQIKRKVQLLAVSKTKPASMLMQAYDAGHRHFGENYVQELVDKSKQLPEDIKWHFIGHLQTNKCRKLLETKSLDVVESVDSLKLATQLNKACESTGRDKLKIFIQVNTSGEPSKFGCEPKECVSLTEQVVKTCSHLEVSGLMTIGAYEADPTPLFFQRLAACRESIFQALPQLKKEKEADFQMSMGMSHDFELALEHGSSEVRVGSAIFGSRVYADQYKDKDKEEAEVEDGNKTAGEEKKKEEK